MLCGSFRNNLVEEVKVNKELERVSRRLQRVAKSKRKAAAAGMLREARLKLPTTFSFSLDYRMAVSGFVYSECRTMDSKKVPLWLTCTNAQPATQDLMVMFKCGDDLRQDVLTLQLISLMDELWLAAGLDLRMTVYKVIATRDMVGMIEIVLDSATTERIN